MTFVDTKCVIVKIGTLLLNVHNPNGVNISQGKYLTGGENAGDRDMLNFQ